MVHVAPDSRLLVSLVKHEQAYATQLHSVLSASGTSLSALTAYASSSPPTVSPVLNGIAGAFAGADQALRMYGEALNDWIHQLGRIKEKEDDVANIGRDREILVTRLLKVSQKSKSPPQSLLHAAPDPSSSTSFTSFNNSKINAAQAELQACESQLAERERELEQVRVQAIRQGLNVRVRALIQCARVWDEMGRRAIDLLDRLDGIYPQANGHATEFFKPLPDPTRDHDRDSLLSSLSPSQSASQTGAIPVPPPSAKAYRLDVPPPHLMADVNVFPEVSEPEGSSSSEDKGPVEVYENPRFNPATILNKNNKDVGTSLPLSPRNSPIPFPGRNSSELGPAMSQSRDKKKKRAGLLGSIATLFRTSMTSKSVGSSDDPWPTHADHYSPRAKTDVEQSSDEEVGQRWSSRLRKNKRGSVVTSANNATLAHAGNGDVAGRSLDLGVSATVPRRKRKAMLSRDNSVRSTISEPQSGSRLRAHTLSAVSPQPSVLSDTVHRHGRTMSMDGGWGRPGDDIDTASLHTWKPSKTKGESLMKIMEGPQNDDPSSRLVVVRAPGSSVPRLPLLVHPPPPLLAPASAPTSPVTPKAVSSKRASMPVPTTVTPGLLVTPSPTNVSEKKPLRSAMRKSPSPSRSPSVRAAADEQPAAIGPLSLARPSSPSPSPRPGFSLRPGIPSTIIESPRQSVVDSVTDAHRQSYTSTKTDDSASVSSYETGHENFDEEDNAGEMEQESTPQPAPLAPVPVPAPSEPSQLAPVAQAHTPAPPALPLGEKAAPPSSTGDALRSTAPVDHQELSSATSTDTAAQTRRKSVRMSSLPPQISATPPALDEYNDADHAPWSTPQQQPRLDAGSGWHTRIQAQAATLSWDDSSSEDDAYKEARRALTLVAKKPEKKARR